MQSPFLFVYGTLKSDAINTNANYLHEHSKLLGEARWRGSLYLVSNYPGAVPSTSKNEYVLGEVWKLADPKILLPLLDEYEECAPTSPTPHEYRRSLEWVELRNESKAIQAWVYIYNLEFAHLQKIESGNFRNDNEAIIRRVF